MSLVINVNKVIATYVLKDGSFVCTHEAMRFISIENDERLVSPLYAAVCANPDCAQDNDISVESNECWQ